jgi:hypothetical protein
MERKMLLGIKQRAEDLAHRTVQRVRTEHGGTPHVGRPGPESRDL